MGNLLYDVRYYYIVICPVDGLDEMVYLKWSWNIPIPHYAPRISIHHQQIQHNFFSPVVYICPYFSFQRKKGFWIESLFLKLFIIIIINTDHTIFLAFIFREHGRSMIPVTPLLAWSHVTWEGAWAVSLWKKDLIVSWRLSRDLLPLVNIWNGGFLISLDLCPTVKDSATCCQWRGGGGIRAVLAHLASLTARKKNT